NYSFSSVALRVPLWNSIPHPPPILRQELQVHETKCLFSESVSQPCFWLVGGANTPALAYGSWAVQGRVRHQARTPAPTGIYHLADETFLCLRALRSSAFHLWLHEENGHYRTAATATISTGF